VKPKSQVKIEGRVIPGREIALFQIYCPSPWQPTVLVSAQPKNSRPAAGSLAITKERPGAKEGSADQAPV